MPNARNGLIQLNKKKMNTHVKRKIGFALTMALFTTGLISFTVITVNLGFVDIFLQIWIKSWLIAYVIAVPSILILGPQIEKLVHHLIKDEASTN